MGSDGGPNSGTLITAAVNGQQSAPQIVPLSKFAPAIFTMDGSQGAILNAQGLLVDSAHPAHPGDVISIYCTGLGPVTNQPPTGSPALSDPLSVTTTIPTVNIGFSGEPYSSSVPVLFSGLAPGTVGLYQVNVQVPNQLSMTGGVTISIGGVESNSVNMGYLSNGAAPSAPGALVPFSVSTPNPTLTWFDSQGATGYTVMVKDAAGNVIFNQNVASYPVLPVTKGSYCWTVAAYNSYGSSPPNSACFTVWPGFTGRWTGTWFSSSATGSLTANLTQAGAQLTGTVSFGGTPCFTHGTVLGTIFPDDMQAAMAQVTIDMGGGHVLSADFNPGTIAPTNSGLMIYGSWSPLENGCDSAYGGTFSLYPSQ